MVSIKNLLSSALFATLALAQEPSGNFSSAAIQGLAASTSNPSSADKLAWCQAQRALCGTLCSGNAPNNTCEQTTLAWTCNCASNNSQPALKYYQTSMITFECNALLGNCLSQHANDLGSQDQCKKMYICGNATAQDATNAANAVSTASSSSSSAPSASNTGSGGSGATSSVAKAGAAISSEYAPPMFVMMMVGAIASFL